MEEKDEILDEQNKEEIKKEEQVSTFVSSTSNNNVPKTSNGLTIASIVIAGLAIVISVIALFISLGTLAKNNVTKNDNINNFANKINERIEEGESEYNTSYFNNNFEIYKGTQNGDHVGKLLDNVMTSLKKNAEHEITVIYNNTSTSNPDEILVLKNSFKERNKYEISLDYDIDGYVNRVTIYDK